MLKSHAHLTERGLFCMTSFMNGPKKIKLNLTKLAHITNVNTIYYNVRGQGWYAEVRTGMQSFCLRLYFNFNLEK